LIPLPDICIIVRLGHICRIRDHRVYRGDCEVMTIAYVISFYIFHFWILVITGSIYFLIFLR